MDALCTKGLKITMKEMEPKASCFETVVARGKSQMIPGSKRKKETEHEKERGAKT